MALIELGIKTFRSEDFPDTGIEPEPLWTSIARMRDDFNLSRSERDELEHAIKLELARPTHRWCQTGDYSSHMFAVVHGFVRARRHRNLPALPDNLRLIVRLSELLKTWIPIANARPEAIQS